MTSPEYPTPTPGPNAQQFVKQNPIVSIYGGAAVLTLIAAFLPWVSVDIKGFGGSSGNAFEVALGFLAPLAALALAGLAFMMFQGKAATFPAWSALALGGAIVVSAVAGLIDVLSYSTPDDSLYGGILDDYYSVTPGFGLYLTLIVGAAVAVVAFLQMRKTQAPSA